MKLATGANLNKTFFLLNRKSGKVSWVVFLSIQSNLAFYLKIGSKPYPKILDLAEMFFQGKKHYSLFVLSVSDDGEKIIKETFYVRNLRMFVISLCVRPEPTQVRRISDPTLQGRLLALHKYIRQGWKGLPGTKAPAFYEYL